MRRAVAVIAATALLTLAAPASAGVAITSLDDVRACTVRNGGTVLSATTGGVAQISQSGKVERVWTTLDGLPDTKANALLESGNDVFIGTDGGVALLRDGKITRTIKTAAARTLVMSGSDLYVGTWGDGVVRIAEGATVATKIPFAAAGPEGRKRVATLALFEGKVIAGTMGGVVRLVDGKLEGAASLVAATFSIAPFGNRLFVGTAEGLLSIGTFDKAVARRESDVDVRALANWSNQLVAGSFGNGLLAIGKDASLAATSAPKAKYVQALGILGGTRCVGTPDGLFVSNDGKTFVAQPPSSLVSNDIAALARDGDRIYVGTFDRGLSVIEGGIVKKISSPSLDDKINAIAIERPKTGATRVWVATARGLTLLEGGKHRRFGEDDGLPSFDVHTVVALAGGGVIAGTSKGAVRIDGISVTPIGKKQGAPSDAVWAVAELANGALLLGTNAGLFHGKIGGKWARLSMVTGHLKDDWVMALAVKGNDVWVGTYAGGVTRLAMNEGAFVADHLGGGYVNANGITIEGDKIWVATMDGLLSRTTTTTSWTKATNASLGVDVTAIVPAASGHWVASRRGLLLW